MRPQLKVLLSLLLVTPLLAHPAQGAGPLLSKLATSAFSMDVPAGWRAVGTEIRYGNAEPLYELTPMLPDDPGNFYAPTPRILVMYYRNRVPSEAAFRWESFGKHAEVPSPRELSTWRLSEVPGRQFSAYTMLGKDVVVIGLFCKDSGQYEEGKRALLSMLASYREVKEE